MNIIIIIILASGDQSDFDESSASDEDEGIETLIVVGDQGARVEIIGTGRRAPIEPAVLVGGRGPPPPVPPRVTRQDMFRNIDADDDEAERRTKQSTHDDVDVPILVSANISAAAAASHVSESNKFADDDDDDDDDDDLPPLEDFDVPIGQFEDPIDDSSAAKQS